MGLEFHDFCPRRTKTRGLLAGEDYETFDAAVAAASRWIDEHGLDVVNVETVVLPNMHDSDEQGSVDSHLRASGKTSTHWNQFVRVWYRVES